MSSDDKYQEALEKAKESAKQLFKEKPEDIRKEFEKETIMGNPENLFKPNADNLTED